MLDQNTDRMWYVIGAVLVGAAIILIANGTLPQMFASVTDSFEDISESATLEISEMDIGSNVTNLIDPSLVTAKKWVGVNGSIIEHETSFVSDKISVVPGSTLKMISPSRLENIDPKFDPELEIPYPISVMGEYRADGTFIRRNENRTKKPVIVELSNDTAYVIYSGKHRTTYVGGLHGHRLEVVEGSE